MRGEIGELGNAVEELQIKKQLKESGLSSSDEITAKYKLEIYFKSNRSAHHPYGGLVVAWTNGGFMHGGGDETIYFCSAESTDENSDTKTCGAPIDLRFINREVAICETCRSAIKPKELTGQIYANLTTEGWVRLITKLFYKLDCNADIRLGIMPGDLRKASEQEQTSNRHGDSLAVPRGGRKFIIYTLSSIVRDTLNGSSIESRIKAFLNA